MGRWSFEKLASHSMKNVSAHERCTEQVKFIVIRLLPRRCISTNVGMIPIREMK